MSSTYGQMRVFQVPGKVWLLYAPNKLYSIVGPSCRDCGGRTSVKLTSSAHLCKSKSRKKHRRPWRARESAHLIESGWPLRISGLSAVDSCTDAEPYIHLRPRTPKSRRRRLSLCSLPVPKQFVVSLRSRPEINREEDSQLQSF